LVEDGALAPKNVEFGREIGFGGGSRKLVFVVVVEWHH